MSTNRSRRIDRDAAEQLLGGAVGGPSAGQDASLTGPDGGPGQLARVLAAAAAPATAGELAGEEAALAAFRKASLTPDPTVTPVRRRSMATAVLARAFSTKATAVVLGTTALCGVAVAAGTGNLPPALGGGPSAPEHRLSGRDAVTGPASGPAAVGSSAGAAPFGAVASGSARPSGSASAGPQAVVPSGPATPGTPSPEGRGGRSAVPPALLGLCTGFADRTAKGDRPSRLAGESLYGPLVAAAGGADRVTDYCRAAIDDEDGEDGDHQGATGPARDPGRTGSGSGANAGSGKGNTGGGRTDGSGNSSGSGSGNGRGNANGGSDGEDTGGAGTRPGKSGVTAPAVPNAQDGRPDKPDRTENEQSAGR
ncbi:hypothetical protein ACFVUY_02715 [Kitasatospora sp. NPDC058063]|uniref:hypothetical protein n=1 Tax=unclassified Kitasatospora TaxID=2633591 RepID=UPI0036D8058D